MREKHVDGVGRLAPLAQPGQACQHLGGEHGPLGRRSERADSGARRLQRLAAPRLLHDHPRLQPGPGTLAFQTAAQPFDGLGPSSTSPDSVS
ncbi:hypothetical protein [Streptosporangium sp. NPDC002721]|uniref:hypothetical protein n=1 Tax=Streptosporangium sp. NPDC002721 TaxID=3366188 RepID=UPI003674A601